MLPVLVALLLAIDPGKSKATFSVPHIFVARVNGTIAIASGSVDVPADSPIPTSVTAQLTPATVKTDDSDRDGALTSPDFFDVKEYPVWTFTSTKITPVSATSFGIDGTITIRGVTQPEHLDATITGDPARPTYHAVGHIDRKAFKMPITRLDPVIGGTVDIALDIITK